ncbi:MAG TPA: hypothetical protein PKM78_08120 [Anaerolineae bacterium]|nr:hypothetical protein [Anaerolineae bacterium]HNU04291.1 hypothetical protein [Anaerolineae bacterium]
MTRIRRHFDRELILLFVLSAFVLAPLTSPGYFFDAHDADHSVFFLVEFDKAIRDGALWPRWGPDHALGYGYPLWLLYAPLAYYVAEGFHLLGLGFTAAVKGAWALGLLFGGWGMFLLLRRWFGRGPAGRAAALVGGLLYVYAPYHLLNITVRAAFAEFSALAWFPWVLLAFDRTVSPGDADRPWRAVALAALAYGGLLLTHPGTILLFTPLLLVWLLFAWLRRGLLEGWPWAELGRCALRVAAGGLLAVGLAAIFLLPMLLEQRYILQEQWVQGSYGYRGHFVYLSQLLDPFWGYGFSDDLTGPNDGLSFQLGIVGVVLALTAAVVGLRRGRPQRGVTGFFLAATLASLAMMLPLAQPLWDAVGPAALIQFPWRLLGIASLGLAILGGAAVASLLWPVADAPNTTVVHNTQAPGATILALTAVLASLAFTLPQYTDIEPIDESALSIIRFETTYPEMIGRTVFTEEPFTDTPLVAQYLAGQPLEKVVTLAGDAEVSDIDVRGASVRAQVDAAGPATVLFRTYDFPGWRATIDGQRVPHRTQPPYGLIALDVPAGQHQVAIRHGTTPVRTAGALISALSLAAAAVLFFWPLRRARSGGTPSRR